MIISDFTRAELATSPRLLDTMHEDRKRVFVDALQWEIPNDGTREEDQFDNDDALYLVLKNEDRTHRASVRLLDSDKPHILGSLFPFLCDDAVPQGPKIKEITRYLASPRNRAPERLISRNMMARALIEYGLENGIEKYTAVCDLSFLSQILSAGWRCDPLGMPRKVGNSVIGAFCIHVEEDSIGKMARSWRYSAPAYQSGQGPILVAA